MSNQWKLLSFGVFAALTASSVTTVTDAAPNTYYVDQVLGNDNAAGTQAALWKSLAKVAATELKPGETVLLRRGGPGPAGSRHRRRRQPGRHPDRRRRLPVHPVTYRVSIATISSSSRRASIGSGSASRS